jgi:hypothetical protein
MATLNVEVQRFSVTTSSSFESVLSKLEASVSHPDVQAFTREMAASQSPAELERIVQKVVGPTGIMEFTRFNIGEVLRIERGPGSARILRLVIGNPLIMKEMAKHVPDAASYAPVTILIDERPDGVHLSYDRMASYLSPYGSEEALKVARELDDKIEAMLTAAAGQEAYPIQRN